MGEARPTGRRRCWGSFLILVLTTCQGRSVFIQVKGYWHRVLTWINQKARESPRQDGRRGCENGVGTQRSCPLSGSGSAALGKADRRDPRCSPLGRNNSSYQLAARSALRVSNIYIVQDRMFAHV